MEKFQVPIDITHIFFSLLASIISFCIVNQQIKFAYYFYCFTTEEEQTDLVDHEEDDTKTRLSKKY